MVIWAIAVLFLAVALGMFAARKTLAHWQSLATGGTTPPGCVTAEAMALALLGLAIVIAYELGYLGEL